MERTIAVTLQRSRIFHKLPHIVVVYRASFGSRVLMLADLFSKKGRTAPLVVEVLPDQHVVETETF